MMGEIQLLSIEYLIEKARNRRTCNRDKSSD